MINHDSATGLSSINVYADTLQSPPQELNSSIDNTSIDSRYMLRKSLKKVSTPTLPKRSTILDKPEFESTKGRPISRSSSQQPTSTQAYSKLPSETNGVPSSQITRSLSSSQAKGLQLNRKVTSDSVRNPSSPIARSLSSSKPKSSHPIRKESIELVDSPTSIHSVEIKSPANKLKLDTIHKPTRNSSLQSGRSKPLPSIPKERKSLPSPVLTNQIDQPTIKIIENSDKPQKFEKSLRKDKKSGNVRKSLFNPHQFVNRRVRSNSNSSSNSGRWSTPPSALSTFNFSRSSKGPQQSQSQLQSTQIDLDLSIITFDEAYSLSTIYSRFVTAIPLTTHNKNHLVYHNAFTGKQAADTLSFIIPGIDRKGCLMILRSLFKYRLINDATFESVNFIDSSQEIYSLSGVDKSSQIDQKLTSSELKSTSGISLTGSVNKINIANGIFTCYTRCYSPTCQPENAIFCYSSSCPNKPKASPALNRHPNSISNFPKQRDMGKIWADIVPPSVLESTPDKEKKRQEAIYEAIYTESDFLEDLMLLNEYFIQPLANSDDIIPEDRRSSFIEKIFFNVQELVSITNRFSKSLNARQIQDRNIVSRVGDIFLDHINYFEPFVAYGAHQLFAKFTLDREMENNIKLREFLEEREHWTELRKLPIQSFLGRPTTRLGKYPLLLDVILKHTPPDHPDHPDLTKTIEIIKSLLTRINLETGKADNKIKLIKLEQKLHGTPQQLELLNLPDEGRLIIRDGLLKRKQGVDTAELQCFLFDHMFLMTKKKKNKENSNQYSSGASYSLGWSGEPCDYKIHKQVIYII
jgi:hypothetical protein